MLPKNQVVKCSKLIERLLYDSVCTVIISDEYQKENGVTAFREKILYQNEPCRISQPSTNIATNNNVVSETGKIVNLYVAPDLVIPAGSKILVTFNDITTEYKNSGESARYDAHQKIQLEFVGRWV